MIYRSHPDRMLLRNQPWLLKWSVGLLIIFASLRLEFGGGRTTPDPEVQDAFFVNLLLLIVVSIATELLRPKVEFEDAKKSGIGDFSFPTATEGRVVPLIWGRVKIDGPNVIWYGDVEAVPNEVTESTGWFSDDTYIESYDYTLGVQFGICRGPGVDLVRVWLGAENKYLVYDAGVLVGEQRFDVDKPDLHFPPEGDGVQATCDFYPGSDTQLPNAYLDDPDRQRVSPFTTIPRMTGMSYIVIREMTSADASGSDTGAIVGRSTVVDPWAFEVQRFPGIFPGQSAGEQLVPASSGVDCNPINVLFEILTDSIWGMGYSSAEIDTGVGSSFELAADTLNTEGNGFSFVLDTNMDTSELISEIERQIDGILFVSQETGLWTIKLARADYNIVNLPHFTEANTTYENYAKGTFEDTTNSIEVKFWKRSDDYKESFALAKDPANVLSQGGGTFATSKMTVGKLTFPGVKLDSLANSLVWRELRHLAFPVSRVTFTVSREFWQLNVASVIKWSDDELGISELPMRVMSIDFGVITANKITIEAVQDIFRHTDPAGGAPEATNWLPQVQTPVDYPALAKIHFEMPRAMSVRAPDYLGDDTVCRIFTSVLKQTTEVYYDVMQRNDPANPSGTFVKAGRPAAFQLVGELKNNLNPGIANPQTITLAATPSGLSQLNGAFDAAETLLDIGSKLTQMVYIQNTTIGDGEIIFVRSTAINGSDIDLENCYRGALDTAQGTFLAGARVYLFSLGGAPSNTTFVPTNIVDLKLLPRTYDLQLAIGDATTATITLANRVSRPYAPAAIRYNGGGTDFVAADWEGDGSGLNGVGFTTEWLRRSHDASDELATLLVDTAPTITTDYRVEVLESPYSSPSDQIFLSGWVTASSLAAITRLQLLSAMTNAAVASIEVRIRSRHTKDGLVNIESRQEQKHRFSPTTSLTGQVAMGKVAATNYLGVYTVVEAGVHTINIGVSYASTTVSVRINGGAPSVVITATNTTGVTGALSVSDTIEIRHDASQGSDNFVELKRPNGSSVAYGIFSS